MARCVIGIDAGIASGAVAVIVADAAAPDGRKLAYVGRIDRRGDFPDVVPLRNRVLPWCNGDTRVFIEKQSAVFRRKDRVTVDVGGGAFKQVEVVKEVHNKAAENAAWFAGYFAHAGFAIAWPTPGQWRKTLGMVTRDDRVKLKCNSIERAKGLFPDTDFRSSDAARLADDGMCEAALIAEHGWRVLAGQLMEV